MQPHRFFIATALIFGLTYVCIVPPFQAPDEFNHFYRSWQIADGGWVGKKTSDNRLGDSLPISLLIVSKPFAALPFHFEERIKTSTIFSYLSVPTKASDKTFIDFTNTAVYAPPAYLPQSLSISVCKHFELHPLSIFYLSRLFTFLVWLIIIYTSIKIAPIQKWLLVFLALLPSSLFINTSLNADVITNAFSFLSISLFLKMFFEKDKILKLEISAFIFCTSLISLNKMAYFPLLFLFFLIPKKQFSLPLEKHFYGFLLLFCHVFVIIGWSKVIQPLYIRFEEYHSAFRIGQQLNEGVDPSAQLSFIIHNPLTFSKILFFSFIQTLPHTFIHYIGKFGWEKNYLPLTMILPLFLVLILRGISETQIPYFRFSTKQKGLIMTIGLLMCICLATVMYLIWCPVGSSFIENLSGKYFIPIFPLFFICLPTFDLKKYRFFTTEKWTAAWLWLTLIYGVWQVCERYYFD
ncbi:MAG: DUF2142 domain-containing protein [Saprospiraceae bacterium]|nr:DUF2142 domain-containing protein [Saprospiraceae bacterium]